MNERYVRRGPAYVRRPMAEPFRATIGWRDVAECVGLTLFLLFVLVGPVYALLLAGAR